MLSVHLQSAACNQLAIDSLVTCVLILTEVLEEKISAVSRVIFGLKDAESSAGSVEFYSLHPRFIPDLARIKSNVLV